ncbi:endolytic transglycosylase MltG [Spirillospora sp. CA-294931]|uniref:endolytic transglycosylase MltG n=1 Tax=Spirillospora sp. CA-294931 TaxID=3240042 RepID=UPI003D8FA382
MSDLDLFSDPHGEGRPHPRQHPPGRGPQRQARKRQQRRRANGRAAGLFAMAFVVAVFGTGGLFGYVWLDKRMNPPDYKGEGSGKVTVQVKEGASGSAIASTLQEHDVVKSVRAFMKVYSKEPKATSLQPGFYQMRKQMSSKSAMALLLDPKSRSGNQLTVTEGKRADEVFQELSKRTGISVKKFQAVAADTKGLGLPDYARGQLEGYLAPGRYDINPNSSPRQIIKQMVDRFNQMATQVDLVGEAERVNLDPATVITFASVIQAEGGKPEDFPKISRVFLNRIKIKMPLQSDATVLYALKKRTLDVRHRDLQVKSPYNTYKVQGLPPGPIGNMGPETIQAVLKPAKGTWLYFVATDPHKQLTEFATTSAEFERLVAKFRAWQKANPGN